MTAEITLHTYRVEYRTVASPDELRVVEVEALDAIDAKHLAEAREGELIDTAKARKIR